MSTKLLKCLQKYFINNYNIINLYFNDKYDFDILDNKYKVYYLNIMRNNGRTKEAVWKIFRISEELIEPTSKI